ncbi:MAG TPA: hypothetical protein DIT05_07725 [Morganella sp. (in: Bacteria)]|nr:hypothetical protein [Morganella sp. (in: enterobacteria)]
MKELSVSEREAVSGSGLFDFLNPFSPGTGNVSPPVTPPTECTGGGKLIIGAGIGFGIGIFPFFLGPMIGFIKTFNL